MGNSSKQVKLIIDIDSRDLSHIDQEKISELITKVNNLRGSIGQGSFLKSGMAVGRVLSVLLSSDPEIGIKPNCIDNFFSTVEDMSELLV